MYLNKKDGINRILFKKFSEFEKSGETNRADKTRHHALNKSPSIIFVGAYKVIMCRRF